MLDREEMQAQAAGQASDARPGFLSSPHFWDFVRGTRDHVTQQAKEEWLRQIDREFGPRAEQMKEDAREAGMDLGALYQREPPRHGKYETEMRRAHVEHPLGLMDRKERESLELLVDSVRGAAESQGRHLYSPVRGAVPADTAESLIRQSQVRLLHAEPVDARARLQRGDANDDLFHVLRHGGEGG